MEKRIKEQALKLGFDAVGITDASPIPPEHIEYLRYWLEKGYAGQMAYMQKNFDKRVNPALLLEGAKSIICVGLNYNVAQPPPAVENNASYGKIAAYACYEDYHKFIKEKLYLLADFVKSIVAGPFEFKVCVDSAPLAERSIAARAGLGFIAKNHMLTHPVFGQQLLLGELITSLPLKQDQALKNGCAGCNECYKACPTGVLTEDGTFDTIRCISYLTIEHKDVISEETARKIGDKLFGCDDCVLACPHHKDAPPAASSDFAFHKERQRMNLCQIVEMDEEVFEKRFEDSPMLRTGLDRLKRNAVICLQNIAKS